MGRSDATGTAQWTCNLFSDLLLKKFKGHHVLQLV